MNLITHDKTTRRPVVKHSIPFITVGVSGKFNLSQGARRLLKLNEGDRAIFHQDKVYRSDWYLEITREDRGYKIVLGKTDTRFTSHGIAHEIFKSIGQKPQKLTFPISEKPFLLNSKFLYKIGTNKSF